jgi:hypothetical protein
VRLDRYLSVEVRPGRLGGDDGIDHRLDPSAIVERGVTLRARAIVVAMVVAGCSDTSDTLPPRAGAMSIVIRICASLLCA